MMEEENKSEDDIAEEMMRMMEEESGVEAPEGGDDNAEEDAEAAMRQAIEEEADTAWDESLDSYLDDCILPELPEEVQRYFDREAWKRDARMDGRGHCLNSYDGSEEDAGDYVAFREN